MTQPDPPDPTLPTARPISWSEEIAPPAATGPPPTLVARTPAAPTRPPRLLKVAFGLVGGTVAVAVLMVITGLPDLLDMQRFVTDGCAGTLPEYLWRPCWEAQYTFGQLWWALGLHLAGVLTLAVGVLLAVRRITLRVLQIGAVLTLLGRVWIVTIDQMEVGGGLTGGLFPILVLFFSVAPSTRAWWTGRPYFRAPAEPGSGPHHHHGPRPDVESGRGPWWLPERSASSLMRDQLRSAVPV